MPTLLATQDHYSPKPLAMYIFAGDKRVVRDVVGRTSSGGVGVNVTLFHIACPEMEFGGGTQAHAANDSSECRIAHASFAIAFATVWDGKVGPSGMGAYNGRHTFEAFTHRRAVLDKATWLELTSMYPPFKPSQLKALDRMADGFKVPPALRTAGLLAVAGAAAYAVAKL